MAQTVKNLSAVCKTWDRSLSWKDPLEKGMATHSSILAWRIPLDRGAWRATVHGITKSQTQLSDFHSLTYALLWGKSQYDIYIINEDQTQKNDFLSIKMENFMQ